jgi:hypothetical protein
MPKNHVNGENKVGTPHLRWKILHLLRLSSPQGFGFIQFASPDSVDSVQEFGQHEIMDRQVCPKRVCPKHQATPSLTYLHLACRLPWMQQIRNKRAKGEKVVQVVQVASDGEVRVEAKRVKAALQAGAWA